MSIKICIAGATGWAGSALSKGVLKDPEIVLVSGISRSNAGKDLAEVLDIEAPSVPVFGNIEEALEGPDFDILFEFTKPGIAKHNVLQAIQAGKNVIVGTSGLSDADYSEIETQVHSHDVSVLAVGNFAITAVLLQKFAVMAAKYIPNFEIIDYASHSKPDAPSGTTLELAKKLSEVQTSADVVKDEDVIGYAGTRGEKINGVRVHTVRLPSYMISVESIFGLSDERLTIRHDSGMGADPYVKGAILAIKKVNTFKGFKRGLDSVLDEE
ncbi:4-hydroxy-tetrahydrodipicolinate reductase [Elizabethkingia meningoseptica]|uniref:4-hydroxy-tetrahydrodipicolinate reductase n=1 Tax=Elizabethkingia meningoseptica TaxID=238 RepID=UPI0022F1DBC8|nr:4-hydroxy-tetrahydrodipicolinate reductase [Elizabethkingia meningoseptica]EJK5329421.1 4-hydroxy-tetrahydrodipicolinate reductase [Elizabethkingia meningoseptica]WBS75824.1 4-hydroxy-tetrahydrodipicolinate reductase [Elizabethkingia meningoseptica]